MLSRSATLALQHEPRSHPKRRGQNVSDKAQSVSEGAALALAPAKSKGKSTKSEQTDSLAYPTKQLDAEEAALGVVSQTFNKLDRNNPLGFAPHRQPKPWTWSRTRSEQTYEEREKIKISIFSGAYSMRSLGVQHIKTYRSGLVR